MNIGYTLEFIGSLDEVEKLAQAKKLAVECMGKINEETGLKATLTHRQIGEAPAARAPRKPRTTAVAAAPVTVVNPPTEAKPEPHKPAKGA